MLDVDPDRYITSVIQYENGHLEVVRAGAVANSKPPGGERGKIKHLSARARSKMLHTLSITAVQFRSMATLTYPETWETDGKKVKESLRVMLQNFKRKKLDYFWFLEFQERGAPHIHVLTSKDIIESEDRAWMAHKWVDAIGLSEDYCNKLSTPAIGYEHRDKVIYVHSRKQAWDTLRSSDGAIRYVSKYALKTKQKDVPLSYQNVGRFWGCTQSVRKKIIPYTQTPIDAQTLRNALDVFEHKTAKWDFLPKYIFRSNSED